MKRVIFLDYLQFQLHFMVFKTKYNKTKNKTEYIQAKYYVEMPPTLPNKAASLFKAQGKLKVHRNTK